MTAGNSSSVTSGAAVLGIGASSAIGYGVRQIQAAMAGGLRNFQDARRLVGGSGQPARLSTLVDVDETVPRSDRIASLTQWAVADLLQNTNVYVPGGIPVYVGLANDSPAADLATIDTALTEGSKGLIDPAPTALVGCNDDRIAFLSAMARAIRAFGEGIASMALVVAVDTRCTWAAVDALIRQRRLLDGGDDGTVPGEGAVVALVASPDSGVAREQARCVVASPAFAEDDYDVMRASPLAAAGLSDAFRTLREDPVAGAVRPSTVIAFETGELFFTRTFATGYLRNTDLMPEPLQHELVATHVGDTGAAAAGMALVRADGLMNQPDDDQFQRILLYGHADDGRCGAAMVMKR